MHVLRAGLAAIGIDRKGDVTVTRTPLCSVRYCPAPSDPDWHACVHCGSIAIEHHHVEGRSKTRTLDKTKVVPLCVPIHKKISLNKYGDAILDLDGSKLYRIWNLKNETIHEGVHAWMQEEVMPSEGQKARTQHLDQREVGRDGQVLSDGGEAGGRERQPRPVVGLTYAGSSPPSPSALTHEQRVAIAQQIKNTEWGRQFFAGDTANAWRAEMGEEAEQYICDFGYVQESIANIMRVCEAIPEEMRRPGLRFSHHVVVASENREDMEMWLDACEEEQWSVAEFRRQVKGTKKKERHACPDCGAEHQVKS